jgi:hypothetical protein
MFLNADKIEIKKRSISLTVSLQLDKYEDATDKVIELIEMAIKNGASANILKQVLSENGTLKIENKHTFK